MMHFLKNVRLGRLSIDKTFERDQAAIDAMIGDFKDQRFREVPPDPRLIDPVRIRALRERLTDKYHYQWRSTQANADLVDALFHTVIQASGSRYGLCTAKVALNEKGESPPVYVGPRGHARIIASDEYKLHYYVTACSMNVREFITSYDDAVRLLRSLLPGYSFLLHCMDDRTDVRLEKDGVPGPWVGGGYAALALVLAVLDHLERAPHEARHWRSI